MQEKLTRGQQGLELGGGRILEDCINLYCCLGVAHENKKKSGNRLAWHYRDGRIVIGEGRGHNLGIARMSKSLSLDRFFCWSQGLHRRQL